ncbi:glutamate--tRNA ligase family protein [Verrucomicrobiota bacterium]
MNLKAQVERVPEGSVTRFAPSPTGYLHLGHVLNMLYVWGIARACNGSVVSRMEDHDRGRYRPEHEKAILEDMEWLGFIPDRGLRAADALKPSKYRQSDCDAEYLAVLEELWKSGLVYGCDCTRKQIKELQPEVLDELRYPGLCRDRDHSFDAFTVRFRTPESREVVFEDLRMGRRVQCPEAQCGDFSLRDRHGNWTYQFCCVCDDIRQGVNLIIRGEDIFGSTGRQIILNEVLGGQPIQYFHHGLLHDESGRKLSKRQFSESIDQMRAEGASAADIRGRAAFAGGLTDSFSPLSLDEALGLFGG